MQGQLLAHWQSGHFDYVATDLPLQITIGAKYGPAMDITDQAEASAYLEKCVEHSMRHGSSREEALRIERAYLGYHAGYYNHETRARVEKLFQCAHPVFGAISERGAPTADEALRLGLKAGNFEQD
jgi:hypothetical protein